MPVPSQPLASEPLDDTSLLHFPALRGVAGFVHAVTTRPWNMAPHQGPQADLALVRRRRVCWHLGLPFENLTAGEQIHSGNVVRVVSSDVGAGRDGRHNAISFIDGMICDLPEVPLIMFSADCPLVLAVDPDRRVFGIAHASWRGTAARISEELVRLLVAEFGVRPDGLLAAIGPCAGPERYEVGEEVRRIVMTRLEGGAGFCRAHGDRWLLDLKQANVAQLVACGVRRECISVASECTIGDERFFSHRREGAGTGRFALIAGFR